MARQFDLYRTHEGDYVVVLQSDFLDGLNTRAVCLATLDQPATPSIASLSPTVSSGELRFRLQPHILATLTLTELGTFVASLAHDRDRIIRACDVMLTGA